MWLCCWEAKSQCDYLIVGLQVDPSIDRKEKNSPVQSIVERQAQISAIKYVDEVLVYTSEGDLLDILNMYPIDIRILGEEYRDKRIYWERRVPKAGNTTVFQ